ncbi:MAG: secondary thiamine-phosphate synthase enzyme YjbQ [archaeon]
MIEFSEIEIDTKEKIEFIDITGRAREFVEKSGIKNGILVAFTQHTTSSLKVHERETEIDKALLKDSIEFLEKMAPSSGKYKHDRTNVDGRPNAHSHLKSLMMNSSETIPIRNGKIALGSWQALYFIEMDGPRNGRKIIFTATGE